MREEIFFAIQPGFWERWENAGKEKFGRKARLFTVPPGASPYLPSLSLGKAPLSPGHAGKRGEPIALIGLIGLIKQQPYGGMVSLRSLPLSFAGSLHSPPGIGELLSLRFWTAPLSCSATSSKILMANH